MKIDSAAAAFLYESQAAKTVTADQPGGKAQTKEPNVSKDRIEISSTGTKHNEVLKMKAGLVTEIESYAGAEKLQRLKQQILAGTYNVSSEQIAGAMLKMK